MSVPDILVPKTLERAVDVTVETNILEPVSHQYSSEVGGVTRYVLPAKGVLDAPNCTINFEIVNGNELVDGTDDKIMFPYWSGGLSCFDKITCRVGGQVLSTIQHAGMYATMKTGFKSIDYRSNVLDVRHSSSNMAEVRTVDHPTTAQTNFSNPVTVQGYSQVMNPTLDQSSIYGAMCGGNDNNTLHVPQTNKLLKKYSRRREGPEVSIRLADLFPYFESNMLPLLGMAQVELIFEWNPSVASSKLRNHASSYDNIVVPVAVDAADDSVGYNATFASPPFLSMDYLHYNDQERMKIMDEIGKGLTMNFREVVFTKGINQSNDAAEAVVTSNHLLGMAGKEVQNIYVLKDVKNTAIIANNPTYTRNPTLNKWKSQQSYDEAYNVFINNQKIYNRDVSNPATQYNYLTQCDSKWHCMPTEYDTMNYNANLKHVLLDTNQIGVVDGTAANNGLSADRFPGSKHVIGIPLLKHPGLGNAPGNGERIGSAPIEFTYSNKKATDRNPAITELMFFIEHRRSMVITPLGVTVSDQ